MQLEDVAGPEDLQGRSYEELDDLCIQIRSKLIESVQAHGGHLGSNLGAVELTVALHRVFRSPHDVILWDTGHQAYVHKMLTGRLEGFESLRRAGGLSGYPSQAESAHDWIENSHASTALSYAHGLVVGFGAADARRRVAAVVGDGALTGGMAFEGLNNLGHSGRNVVIVLNDNGRSYAPTVSRLSESLVKIRANPTYMRRQARLEEIAERIPWVGETIQRGVKMSKAAIRELWEPPAFFENLGIRYIGPFDGHDIASLEEALTNASEFEGPVVVHVLTQKGRGYKPAEDDHVKHMHDAGSVRAGTYTGVFSETMVKLGELHPELVAITAAMPDSTGLIPFQERFGHRCIDVGIAEQHAVTAATGMAMAGLRPLIAGVQHVSEPGLRPDQPGLRPARPAGDLLHRPGRRHRRRRALPPRAAGHGAAHQGAGDDGAGPLVGPGAGADADRRHGHGLGPGGHPLAKTAARPGSDGEVGSGVRARRARAGDGRVCLIGVGKMLEACEGAADRLAEAGVAATVWDPRAVSPLDPEMIADAAGHELVVTAEDGLRAGGAGFASPTRPTVRSIWWRFSPTIGRWRCNRRWLRWQLYQIRPA